MQIDFTTGSIGKKIFLFTLPLMAGDVFQQLYNVVDTLIVGRYAGVAVLAAVGSSYTLMTFLSSVLIGLCMGSSAWLSIQVGRGGQEGRMRTGLFLSFLLIGILMALLTGASYLFLPQIIHILQIPPDVVAPMKEYLTIILMGMGAVFLLNYLAAFLRAIGNSVAPLYFLSGAMVINIVLDLYFIVSLHMGASGAAWATVISQYAAAVGLALYCAGKMAPFWPKAADRHWDRSIFKEMCNLSLMTSVQQSIMNLGILAIQGLVNSFGTVIMAAFSIAVKIDTLAYTPVQDYGNAFSTFVAQNYGAGRWDRIRKGVRLSLWILLFFCGLISAIVWFAAAPLMGIFVDASETSVIAEGVRYLRIEGSLYIGIGILFLLYGYYRAINSPFMSIVLTVISLGTRVALAFLLAPLPEFGVSAIWAAIPIGWFLADMVGLLWMRRMRTA